MRKKTFLTFLLILSVSVGYSQVTVTGSTGANATYATLRLAFTAINATAQTGNDISIAITSSTTETASAALNAGTWNSLTIYPTTTGLTIGGTVASALISFNGADKVTIDGRVNKLGSLRSLTLSNANTGTASSTVLFSNSAELNTVKYCTIKGEESSTSKGVIYLSSSAAGNGNDNNTIDNNNITNAGVGRPINGIFSQGALGYINNGLVISNNDFYDVLKPATGSNGININTFTDDVDITGNSFFETTSFAPSAAVSYTAISIRNTSGVGYNITNNYIGGSQTQCGGIAWTKTKTSNNNAFYAIYVSAGSGSYSEVQNNTIKNFNWGNIANASFAAINIVSGDVNVGTSQGNTIGETTGVGSIILNDSTTGGNLYGIYIQSATSVNCRNNTIGSLTGNNTSTSSTNVYGIYKSASPGYTDISDNIIGSSTTPNSIQAISASTANAQSVYGINNGGSGGVKIQNNTIANLTNFITGTSAGRINGIYTSSGTDTISNNTVRNLKSFGLGTSTGYNAPVVGISVNNSVATSIISNNTVYNLSNDNASFAGRLIGIYFAGYTVGNTISSNFIHSLVVNAASTGATINGLRINGGTSSVTNNIILLDGNTASILTGILETGIAGNDNALYFNTVRVGGTPTSGAYASHALNSSSSLNTRIFKNNLLVNVRSNVGATGTHYALFLNSTTSLSIDYNDYYVSGIGTMLARISSNRATIAAIRTATSQDVNSMSADPFFVNIDGLNTTDYKIKTNLAGVSGAGIPTLDYDQQTRIIPSIGAFEYLQSIWKGTYSSNWGTAGNWLDNQVPAADANILFDSSPLNHCVMDANRSVNDISNDQSMYQLKTNGYKLTVKGDVNMTNGALIEANSAGSTVEFAGTIEQSLPADAFVSNQVYNLLLNNSANVVLSGSLDISNSMTSTSGLLDAVTNSPTVTLSGTSARNIETNTFLSNQAYNLVIDNTGGISLNADTFMVTNNLTINSGRKLTIPTTKKLNVLGSITNSAGVGGLVVKASSSAANGTLIFHNAYGSPVLATVEMYSKAAATTYSGGVYSNYKWQYFGVPLRTITVNPYFNASFVRRWNEPTAKWVSLVNGNSVNSFVGHEVTQPSAKTFVFEGELENSSLSTTLSPTVSSAAVGQFLFANPYTAAIDIKKINFGAQVFATIYLYNTGSYADWTGVTGSGNNPGQYLSIPQNLAGNPGIPDQIPSMQGFFVLDSNLPGDHTFEIPYSAVAMKNTSQLRAPSSAKTTSQIPTVIIDVKGSRFSDRMWIFTNQTCTKSYDNGWDGTKFLGSVLSPQLYTMGLDGDFQISAVDDINNTNIGFKAGEDTNYTLEFTNSGLSSVYDTLYLVDLIGNTVTDITQSGTVYSFTSQPTPTPVNRFRIVTANNTSTAVQSTASTNDLCVFTSNNTLFVKNNTDYVGELSIFNSAGILVGSFHFSANGITQLPMGLPLGTYVSKLKTSHHQLTSKVVFK